MRSAASAAGSTVNAELAAVLNEFGGFPRIVEGVAACAGVEAGALVASDVEVSGFLIRPEEIFSAWLATGNGFHVFEMSRDAVTLTVSVPWSRVARVVVATDDSATTLIVEMDADRVALTGSAANGIVDGSLRPAAYTCTVTDLDQRVQVENFARVLRRHIR